ncbi:hypothetical protein CPB83DRAFT_900978 [Crepidotus variabilis]|uniref:Cyclin N-terminal domain-containing protein n=1 Tax=Crepidotus variabilis TaxID=179855 RepID=A0A9P6E2T4_9AGAR|nr:hypothetical protein CPB83DRAFT_900978 [Crepidotus variabilis]
MGPVPQPLSSVLTPSIHKSSLVDFRTHSHALLRLLDIKITGRVHRYAAEVIIDAVEHGLRRGQSPVQKPVHGCDNSPFIQFLATTVMRAEVTMPTLLVALVYVKRAKPYLHIPKDDWALERICLGSLIVASKYLHDRTLLNDHWSLCSGRFGRRDIGRMEREFLSVLDFDLRISEDDILSHYSGITHAAFADSQPAGVQRTSKPTRSNRHCPLRGKVVKEGESFGV